MMNLLIRGACTLCAHDLQFLPVEGVVDNYEVTCSVCTRHYSIGPAAVRETGGDLDLVMLAQEARDAAIAAAAPAPKATTSRTAAAATT